MEFFKFIKQDTQKQQEQPNTAPPTAEQTPSPEPAPVVVPKKAPVQPPVHVPQKKQKEDACDFFSVDIYNIFKHKPAFAEKYTDGIGRTVEKYILKPDKWELSAFNRIDVLKYENGHYDLHFSGEEKTLNSEIIEFINYCTSVLGPDFMQKQDLSADDTRDMKLGAFSRVWNRHLRIENIYFTLSLTLYDITPQSINL
jgi:hypothetical protein